MSRLLFLVAALAAMSGCASAARQSERTCFHFMEQLEKEIGFCQAVRSENTLHVSGVAAGGAMDSAVRSVYAQLGEILEANGLSFANVLRETVFATDLDAFIESKEIRREFYGTSLPAASWVQVERLYLPSYVVEVELTAEYAK